MSSLHISSGRRSLSSPFGVVRSGRPSSAPRPPPGNGAGAARARHSLASPFTLRPVPNPRPTVRSPPLAISPFAADVAACKPSAGAWRYAVAPAVALAMYGAGEVDEDGMPKLVINASLTAKKGHESVVAQALEKCVRASRQEPGVESYTAYVPEGSPGTFRVFEIYKDEEAGKEHERSAHVASLVETIKESVEGGLQGLLVEKATLLIEE